MSTFPESQQDQFFFSNAYVAKNELKHPGTCSYFYQKEKKKIKADLRTVGEVG